MKGYDDGSTPLVEREPPERLGAWPSRSLSPGESCCMTATPPESRDLRLVSSDRPGPAPYPRDPSGHIGENGALFRRLYRRGCPSWEQKVTRNGGCTPPQGRALEKNQWPASLVFAIGGHGDRVS